MSVLGGNPLLLGGDAGTPSFTTQRSVRLRSSNTAYFNRTPAGAGSLTTWTWSGWVKRGKLGARQFIFSSGVSPTTTQVWQCEFNASDKIEFYNQTIGTYRLSTQVFRDPSAWYHIVFCADTNNGTAQNRFRCWVNGIEITTWDTNSTISSGYSFALNGAYRHTIGEYSYTLGSGLSLDGYLTEVNFIDGQALTPSSFGEYNSVRNTQWKPKAYTGTYGTNGFYLNFSDNSNNTAATIGKDSSGNGNNWTPNGISITAGATYDSMTDVPTLTGETASNFSTLSPIAAFATGNTFTVTEGNLKYTQATCQNAAHCGSTIPLRFGDGMFYYEITQQTKTVVGGDATLPFDLFVKDFASAGATYTNAYFYMQGNNGTVVDPTNTTLGSFGAIANGDIIMVALDLTNGKLFVGKNGTWFNSANPAAGTGALASNLSNYPIFIPSIGNNGGNMTNFSCSINFGQRPFSYTPPTGFKCINTYNLPEPTIASSDDYHNIYTYTGNGGGLQVGEVQKPASLFNLDRSVRLRSSASARFTRTPATAGNRKTWTWSAWVKRGALASDYGLFNSDGATNTDYFYIKFDGSDRLYVGNFSTNFVTTTAIYRDPSLFYHLVVTLDTTQASATDRLKVYVNGIQVTSFATDNRAAQIAQNSDQGINRVATHIIGNTGAVHYFDGYLADVYFIDGQALTPSDFGAYDGNYYWTPKAYTGTYGTNGFHLEFEDFSASTAAAIGKDTSGQGNNWTPSAGINLTTPANTNTSWDSMVDVPTLTSTDVANYCTLDPLRSSVTSLIKDGNLQITGTTTNTAMVAIGNMPVSSGKWYWECIPNGTNSTGLIGIITSSIIPTTSIAAGWLTGQSYYWYYQNGNKNVNGTVTSYGATFTTNDIIGIALDLDAGTITFYKNGTSQGVAATGITGAYIPFTFDASAGSCTINWAFNFGQRGLKYPVTGYKSLNSLNIAEVTGDVETPDFVWIKSRSASGDHALFNSVTGVGKYLRSSSSGVEVTDVNSLIQFNKNGFLLGNAAIVNTSAATYVASAWKAGGTAVTNTAGSITSQVSANPTAGFSIVTYTGIGSSPKTVGHGLGVEPKMILHKDKGNNYNWRVWHTGIGASQVIEGLNTTAIANSQTTFNSTLPTSSVISVGNTDSNTSGNNYLMYVFTDIDGFSKFGSYISNNATDGPFVYTGFRPRWLMVKRAIATAGQTGGWFMYDAARNTYNVMDKYMFAEGTAGDNTLAVFDFTSNGFKIRSNNVHVNTTSGNTYIYMAFAENPFKYALAR